MTHVDLFSGIGGFALACRHVGLKTICFCENDPYCQRVLKQHWLAHAKRICPRCNIPFSKAHLGITQRRAFFCERCQTRYPR